MLLGYNKNVYLKIAHRLFASQIILHPLLAFSDLLQNQLFRKNLSGIPSVTNSLDLDQAGHFGPNCLQILSADNTSRYRVKDANYLRFGMLNPIIISHRVLERNKAMQ